MIEAFIDLKETHSVFEKARGVLERTIGIPVCQSGCGLCCEHNVPNAMTIEAMYAVSTLTGMGKLRKAISLAEGWLLERHSFATIYEGMPQGFVSHKVREESQAITRSQCPFMEPDKSCGIYDARPLSCRAYGVTRDIADLCPRPLGKHEHLTQRIYIPADDLRNRIDNLRAQWKIKQPAWIISGPIPTVLFRAAEPEKFKRMVMDNTAASAKIIGVDYETSLMWQAQINALRKGVSPDVAVAMLNSNRNTNLVGIRG